MLPYWGKPHYSWKVIRFSIHFDKEIKEEDKVHFCAEDKIFFLFFSCKFTEVSSAFNGMFSDICLNNYSFQVMPNIFFPLLSYKNTSFYSANKQRLLEEYIPYKELFSTFKNLHSKPLILWKK